MRRTERFEMRLSRGHKALLDAVRGRTTRSAFMGFLLEREGRRQGLQATADGVKKIDAVDVPASRAPE